MRKLYGPVVSLLFLAGCVTQGPGEPSPARGFGQALGYLVASPVLILAGLFEGIASAPYLVEADLHEMNREMVKAGTDVTLDRTYRYAYGRPLESVPESGSTGKVFRHMAEASAHFQAVLSGYGVAEPERYVLTAVRTADREGYTLYALVYRPAGTLRVRDRSGRIVTLAPGDSAYYRPYERDADGRPFDVLMDWAGVARTSIGTQKGQAILLTLAANSVLINRRSEGYWAVERRWVSGDYRRVVAERTAELDQRMGRSG